MDKKEYIKDKLSMIEIHNNHCGWIGSEIEEENIIESLFNHNGISIHLSAEPVADHILNYNLMVHELLLYLKDNELTGDSIIGIHDSKDVTFAHAHIIMFNCIGELEYKTFGKKVSDFLMNKFDTKIYLKMFPFYKKEMFN